MFDIGLVLFGIFLLVMVGLIVAMFISLANLGDERKQLIVRKASTFTLLGISESLVINIIESYIKVGEASVNSFTLLTATATLYLISLLYYRKKYGN